MYTLFINVLFLMCHPHESVDMIPLTLKKGTELPDDENEIVKLEPDKPAKTLTKSNHLQHYKHKDRGLTIRELARLQSFPDSYWFSGDVKCQRDQIGNAVPCKLAEAIGLFVLRSYLWPYETKADAEMFGKSLEEAPFG